MNTSLSRSGRALLLAALSAFAGSALATSTIGTRVDSYCATQPAQATVPQQSRPYRAANSSCFLCHTGSPTRTNLNAFGSATLSCATSACGATVDPFCVAHAPSNATITAPAAGTSVAQGQSLTFTAGNATNPDGFPLVYAWSFSGGMPNASGQSVSVPMTVAGSITATLQVSNSVGMLATGTAPTRTVTVTGGGGNQPPLASISAPAGDVTVAQGGTVNFQGSGSDPDNNTPLSYSWNFGGGAANSTAQNPGAVRFSTAGSYTVTFTVTDSLGLSSAPVTRTVTVTAPAPVPGAPVATIIEPAGNVTIVPGGTVTFRGAGTASVSASDDDDDEHDDGHEREHEREHQREQARESTLRYSWNFGGGAANSTRQNPGAVRFNTAGVFTVTFTVTDSRGRVSAPVTRIVTVAAPVNKPPVASITAPAGNVTIVRGGTVTFQGSGSDPDGNTPLSYSWDFGGGAPGSTMQNPGAVRFDTIGSYVVTFTVTDSLGLSSAPVTRTVTVSAERGAAATIVKPAMNVSVLPGGSVSFAAEAAADSGKLGYRWSFPGGRPSQSTLRNPGAVKFATPGSYTVTLTVTDSTGKRSTFTRVVTVAAANQSPRLGDCLDDDGHDHDD